MALGPLLIIKWLLISLAADEIIDTSSSLRKLHNINKEIGIISLAYMYLKGLGVKRRISSDKTKELQLCLKSTYAGNTNAMSTVAYSYENGESVDKDKREGQYLLGESFYETKKRYCKCYLLVK
ncbi:hypothetical protein Glove_275g35 [Diversispora epigaea]|uniref:Uncharacterized protein n=1 Tax=Diversispora epigaea TaxID=1348612 RepID=A0A397I3L5_9GLOM|nr:hypothetical protein Glove_275g35 [Diversispora epigaea]